MHTSFSSSMPFPSVALGLRSVTEVADEILQGVPSVQYVRGTS